MRLSYDRSTDGLYIELRALPAKGTREIEPDVMLDIGEDGGPVGYDVQHAFDQTRLNHVHYPRRPAAGRRGIAGST